MKIKFVELTINGNEIVGVEWPNITYADLPKNAVRCSLYTSEFQYLYFYSSRDINAVTAKNFHFAHLKGEKTWKSVQLHKANKSRNDKQPRRKG